MIPAGRFEVRYSAPCYSGIEIRSDLFTLDYRAKQAQVRDLLNRHLEPPLRALAPESVHAPVSDDRSTVDVRRAWSQQSAGFLKLPVAFLRIYSDDGKTLDCNTDLSATLVERYFTIHDYGVIVATYRVGYELTEPRQATLVRRACEAVCPADLDRRATSDVARIREAAADALSDADIPTMLQHVSPEPLGFHRLYWFVSPHGDAVEPMLDLLIRPAGDFHDACPSNHAHAFIGNGSSLFIADDDAAARDFSPQAAIDYYEFYYAALMRADDELFFALADASEIRTPDLKPAMDRLELLKGRARMLRAIESDVVNSFAPDDLAYWNRLIEVWRVPSIETDVDEKMSALQERLSDLHSDATRLTAVRTNRVVIGLTVLTLISIILDVVTFGTADQHIDDPLRWGVIAFALGLAVTLLWRTLRHHPGSE